VVTARRRRRYALIFHISVLIFLFFISAQRLPLASFFLFQHEAWLLFSSFHLLMLTCLLPAFFARHVFTKEFLRCAFLLFRSLFLFFFISLPMMVFQLTVVAAAFMSSR